MIDKEHEEAHTAGLPPTSAIGDARTAVAGETLLNTQLMSSWSVCFGHLQHEAERHNRPVIWSCNTCPQVSRDPAFLRTKRHSQPQNVPHQGKLSASPGLVDLPATAWRCPDIFALLQKSVRKPLLFAWASRFKRDQCGATRACRQLCIPGSTSHADVALSPTTRSFS